MSVLSAWWHRLVNEPYPDLDAIVDQVSRTMSGSKTI